MHLRPRLHPTAAIDLADALAWYRNESEALAERFATAVDATVRRIVELPGAWPTLDGDERHLHVRGFPYHIVYRERPPPILIVAIAHFARRPAYWRSDAPPAG